MSNGDKEFEAYLEGNSDLSRRYEKLGDTEPPADLDSRILAEAERAVKVRELPAGPRRWMLPVSVAATLMICLSLVLNVLREAPPGIDADQYVDAIVPADPSRESVLEPAGKAVPAAPNVGAESPARFAAGGPAPAAIDLLESQAVPRTRKDKGDTQSAEFKKEAAVADVIAVMDENKPAEMEREERDSPTGLIESEPQALESGRLMALGQMFEIVADYLSSRPAGVMESTAQLESTAAEEGLAVEKYATSTSPVMSASALDKKARRPAQDQALPAEPDSELQRIAELYAQGQNTDAENALAEFRKSFPDHPVSRTLLERGY